MGERSEYDLAAADPEKGKAFYAGGCLLDGDAEVSSSRAVDLGGTVLAQPTDIGEGGRLAVLRDPQSAVFGLFADELDP